MDKGRDRFYINSCSKQETKKLLEELNKAIGKHCPEAFGFINPNNTRAIDDFKRVAVRKIHNAAKWNVYDSIVVLCIGSALSEYVADNVGPLTGTLLGEKPHIEGIHIYGTMDAPVNGRNFEQKLEEIYRKHTEPFVISIDGTATSTKWQLNHIWIKEKPIAPGNAINKKTREVGHVSVLPVVFYCEEKTTILDTLHRVKSAKRPTINNLAKVTASGIYAALKTVTSQGVVLLNK